MILSWAQLYIEYKLSAPPFSQSVPCIVGWWRKILLSVGWNRTIWKPFNNIIFWFIFIYHPGTWSCPSQGWSRWIQSWPSSCSWACRSIHHRSTPWTRSRMTWRRRWRWWMHIITSLHKDVKCCSLEKKVTRSQRPKVKKRSTIQSQFQKHIFICMIEVNLNRMEDGPIDK